LKPKIAIIILNWNGMQDTIPCLESVLRIDYPNYEVILVDNGSEDRSVQEIRRRFTSVAILENRENLGFAEGNNRGIELALKRGADYVLLLNNDTEVDPGILQTFAEAIAEHPTTGMFSAKIYFFDEPRKLFYRGAKFIWQIAGYIHVGHHDVDTDTSTAVQDTGYASGCALLASAKMIQKIGMLDVRFYLNWEDIEWSTRSINNGFGCKYVPGAIVYHKVSSSFVGGGEGPHNRYYFRRNHLLWIRLHLGRRYIVRYMLTIFIWRWLLDALTLINPMANPKRRHLAKASFWGVVDYFRGRFGRGPDWLTVKS